MKQCLACSHFALNDAAACLNCGEGSWGNERPEIQDTEASDSPVVFEAELDSSSEATPAIVRRRNGRNK